MRVLPFFLLLVACPFTNDTDKTDAVRDSASRLDEPTRSDSPTDTSALLEAAERHNTALTCLRNYEIDPDLAEEDCFVASLRIGLAHCDFRIPEGMTEDEAVQQAVEAQARSTGSLAGSAELIGWDEEWVRLVSDYETAASTLGGDGNVINYALYKLSWVYFSKAVEQDAPAVVLETMALAIKSTEFAIAIVIEDEDEYGGFIGWLWGVIKADVEAYQLMSYHMGDTPGGTRFSFEVAADMSACAM